MVVRRGDFRLDLSLSLERGERLAVIGPNGAGKSTLLGLLAGHLRLSEGAVELAGRLLNEGPRVRVPAHRRGIVLLGQDPLVFPHLSVRRNIEYGPRSHGLDRAASAAQAAELIDRLGLERLADAPGHALSGGQQQRVALARALAVEPSLLLLDEPFSALDVDGAARLRTETLSLLLERNTTCVVVSHDILDVAALAERTLVIEDGRAADQGPTARVLRQPRSRFAATMGGTGVLDVRVVDGVAITAGGWAVAWPAGAVPGGRPDGQAGPDGLAAPDGPVGPVSSDGRAGPAGPTTTGDGGSGQTTRLFVPPDAVRLSPGGPAEIVSVTAAPAGLAVTLTGGVGLFLSSHWAVHEWLAPGARVTVQLDPNVMTH
jgi:molybdate transport system ATP-binding protein